LVLLKKPSADCHQGPNDNYQTLAMKLIANITGRDSCCSLMGLDPAPGAIETIFTSQENV